jgi:anti-sigma B factor antagonist
MNMEIEKYPQVTVVTLPGETIEANSVEEFKKAILPIVETNTNLIFDMSRIRFIDSMGCSVLVFTARKLKEKEGCLKICCSSPQVTALFDMMGFRNILGIFNSKEEAVQSFR